jgi:hypothetical protein
MCFVHCRQDSCAHPGGCALSELCSQALGLLGSQHVGIKREQACCCDLAWTLSAVPTDRNARQVPPALPSVTFLLKYPCYSILKDLGSSSSFILLDCRKYETLWLGEGCHIGVFYIDRQESLIIWTLAICYPKLLNQKRFDNLVSFTIWTQEL